MDLDDILWTAEKTKKRLVFWWERLPYRNKIMFKLLLGGGGLLLTGYAYLYWVLWEVPIIAGGLGLVFLLIFLSGARDALL
jgi:type II secretory pathway component PulM